MAIVRRPHAGRVRYVIDVLGRARTVQTFSRINPSVQPAQLLPLRQAVNFIRPLEHPSPRGYFTVQDELSEQP